LSFHQIESEITNANIKYKVYEGFKFTVSVKTHTVKPSILNLRTALHVFSTEYSRKYVLLFCPLTAHVMFRT
jgi:hypothetical protein